MKHTDIPYLKLTSLLAVLLVLLTSAPATAEDESGEKTVTIPREMLMHLAIPLFIDRHPSAELRQLLEIDDAEAERISALNEEIRTAYFDYLLELVEVEVAKPDQLVFTVQPQGEKGASFVEQLRKDLQDILGDERYGMLRLVAQADSHYAMMRRHGFGGGRFSNNQRDLKTRQDKALRKRLGEAILSDTFAEEPDQRYEVRLTETEHGWKREVESFRPDGRGSGSSSGSGGDLDDDLATMRRLILEHKGVIETIPDEDGQQTGDDSEPGSLF